MRKFVEGPWEAQPYDDDESGVAIIAVNSDLPKGATPTRGLVAYLHTLAGAHFDDPESCIETADVVAAAPEMLAALEAVSVLRGTLETHGLLEQVDRAIAKARGEA